MLFLDKSELFGIKLFSPITTSKVQIIRGFQTLALAAVAAPVAAELEVGGAVLFGASGSGELCWRFNFAF